MSPRCCTTVYPRVGGETDAAIRARVQEMGLSPRGRGNPQHGGGFGRRDGSIPAWAGKPTI